MAWSLTGHGLLSPDAGALGATALQAHTDLAADLLGLDDDSFTDGSEKEAKAQRAVVLQVNHQVAGEGASALQSRSTGARSKSYRDLVPTVDPVAAKLAEDVGGSPAGGEGDFKSVPSIRGPRV